MKFTHDEVLELVKNKYPQCGISQPPTLITINEKTDSGVFSQFIAQTPTDVLNGTLNIFIGSISLMTRFGTSFSLKNVGADGTQTDAFNFTGNVNQTNWPFFLGEHFCNGGLADGICAVLFTGWHIKINLNVAYSGTGITLIMQNAGVNGLLPNSLFQPSSPYLSIPAEGQIQLFANQTKAGFTYYFPKQPASTNFTDDYTLTGTLVPYCDVNVSVYSASVWVIVVTAQRIPTGSNLTFNLSPTFAYGFQYNVVPVGVTIAQVIFDDTIATGTPAGSGGTAGTVANGNYGVVRARILGVWSVAIFELNGIEHEFYYAGSATASWVFPMTIFLNQFKITVA